jgi:hypothetical protein
MHEPDTRDAPLVAHREILCDHRRNLSRSESVKVELACDRQLDDIRRRVLILHHVT